MKHWQLQKRVGIAGALALVTGLSINAVPAAAAVVSGPFGLHGGAVSNAELAAIRGKFVDGRRVTFFGIKMNTWWRRADKDDFHMQMKVGFDLSRSRFSPRLSMYRTANLGTATSKSGATKLDNVSDNGALESVSGVVQNIQVAGDSNGVQNDVAWVVTDQDHTADTEGLVEVNSSGTLNHVTDDGVATQISADAEGIGYQVDIPDVGKVTQRISRSQLSGGNILQSTQLNSDLNQVLNQIGLTVELSPASSIVGGSRSFHRALRSMRGL